MVSLRCLWSRPRLERHVDGVLRDRAARALQHHLASCSRCSARAEEVRRLRSLVRTALADPVEPTDWSAFWPGIQARIARETPPVVRDSWWLPLWKPFWGHPRLAVGGALAAIMLFLTMSFWPVPDQNAWGAVVVQDVSTPDPDRGVMVYSTPGSDHALTVIWLFNPDGQSDES
jgi:anti-sigma factor RsiW